MFADLDSLSPSQTDFTAKIVDVVPPDDDWPEGLSINISDSIQRCRFREGYTAAVPMPTDGSAVKLAFELYPSAVVIGVGHRLRLDISSSNFPRFDVNDNSGSGLPGVADGAPSVVARQRVWHDAARPSCLRVNCFPDTPLREAEGGAARL